MTLFDLGTVDDDGTGDALVKAGHILNALLGQVLSITDDVGAATASRGNAYIVPASATGAWVGQDDKITYYDGSAWVFITAVEGTTVYVADEDAEYQFDGTDWATTGLVTTTSRNTQSNLVQEVDLGTYDLSTDTLDTGNEIDIDMSDVDYVKVQMYDGAVGSGDVVIMRVSTDGVSYDDGASDYSRQEFSNTAATINSISWMRLSGGTATAGMSGQVEIRNMKSATLKTQVAGIVGDFVDAKAGIWFRDTAQIDTHLRITTLNDNAMTAGTIRVTGYKLVSTGEIGLSVAFKGFRATNSAIQALTAATNSPVTFGTEVFDTESGFASNLYTVPAALDGKYMVFSAGVRFDDNEIGSLFIEQDDGGGYANVSQMSSTRRGMTSTTGPILVSEGDVFRVSVYVDSAANIEDDDRNFFSGYVVETSEDAFDYNLDTNTSRTLTGADFVGNKVIKLENASAITLTLNTGLTANGPLTIIQGGAGTITIAGTATINAKDSATGSNGQYSAFTLIPTETADEYDMIGDIV